MERIKQNFLDNINEIDNFLSFERNNFYNNYSKINEYIDLPQIKELIENFDSLNLDCNHSKNQIIIKELCEQLDCIANKIIPGIEILRSTQISKFSDEYGHNNLLSAVYLSKNRDKLLGRTKLIAKNMYEYFDDPKSNLMIFPKFSIKDCRSAIKYDKIVEEYGILRDVPAVVIYLEYIRNLYYNFYDYNSSNIYRQSFIILMASFDAAISDICTIYWGKSKALSSSISALYEYNKAIFINYNEDIFNKVIELIRRRNIHLHNKGIVDLGYIQPSFPNKDGIHIFTNPCKLRENELAPITQTYLYEAIILLEKVIKNVPN